MYVDACVATLLVRLNVSSNVIHRNLVSSVDKRLSERVVMIGTYGPVDKAIL